MHSGEKPPRMSPDEKRLVREMAYEQGMEPKEIAENVGRHLSNICRLLAQKKIPKMGRPIVITAKQVDRLEKLLESMVSIPLKVPTSAVPTFFDQLVL